MTAVLFCTEVDCTRFAKVGGRCLHHEKLLVAAIAAKASQSIHSLLAVPVTSPRKTTNKNSRQCKATGCTSYARRHGKCSRHGGSLTCFVDGCVTPAQIDGLCRAHGGKRRCSISGCRGAARQHGLCHSHGARSAFLAASLVFNTT
ncbi:Aste57867_10518 [Aphanomyces stellatus]|uniref:Aste57867_10518 protein n=1 Tax=Aphanomyces stellatus TaxID=120398 RepID=A0A485KR31_9STRA|nr:hypothetical protein As57867_010478 [Aphanomyces stellatus]VFT87391.1 Aste57867_10518 [Aphanomyces stellatus]